MFPWTVIRSRSMKCYMLYARCTTFVGVGCFLVLDRPVMVVGDTGYTGYRGLCLVACISAVPLCGTRLRGSSPVWIFLLYLEGMVMLAFWGYFL